jgi:hypothetical protein
MFGEISEMFKVFCLLKSVAGLNRHNIGVVVNDDDDDDECCTEYVFRHAGLKYIGTSVE